MAGFRMARQRMGAYLEVLIRIPDYYRAADQELRRLKRQVAMTSHVGPSAPGAAVDAASSRAGARLAAQQAALAVVVLLALTLTLAGAVRLGAGILPSPPVMIPVNAEIRDV